MSCDTAYNVSTGSSVLTPRKLPEGPLCLSVNFKMAAVR